MSESEQHIEQMQLRLQQMAEREQLLINALNEALSAADRKLLDDVRSVSADHEARRAIIMTELQMLAERIGVLPSSGMRVDTIEYETPGGDEAQASGDVEEPVPAARGGDWRKAAKKITDGLDFHLTGTVVQDTSNSTP